ncbi:MAG: TonB-dependent receptor [Parvularculaceae bacterium]
MKSTVRARLYLTGATSVLVSICCAASAYAEANPDEITVTATRRQQSVQDVPYNISAYSADDLEQAGASDISDLSHIVPGIAYIDQGPRLGANNNGFIIRGLRGTQLASANDEPDTIEPSVSTYLGETPIFFYLVMKDIERVEVLRGPQGTLYGSGAVGGTIRFMPKKANPDEGFTYRVEGETSFTRDASDPGYAMNGVVNIPLSDNMAVRALYGHIRESGFVDNNAVAELNANGDPILSNPADFLGSSIVTRKVEDINKTDIDYGRVSLWWGVNDRIEANLAYNYQNIDSEGRQIDNPDWPGNDRNEVSMPYNEPQKSTLHLVSLDLGVDTGIGQLTSASSYYRIDTDLFADSTNLYSSLLAGNYMGFPRIVAYRGSADSSAGPDFGLYNQRTFVQELRLVSNPGKVLDWVLGGYFLHRDTEYDLADNVPGFADWADVVLGVPLGAQGLPQYRTQISKEFEDKAVFGELTWHVTDRWQVTGGMRAFWQSTDGEQILSVPSASAIMTTLNFGQADPDFLTSVFSLDNSVSDQIFKFNTSYTLNDDTNVYFTWAEGFRRGGANAIFVNLGADPELLTYSPDTATNWEVGVKGRIQNFATYSIAGFYIDWNDFQFSGTEPVNGNLYIDNGAGARSIGAEMELGARIGDRISVDLGYTFTDAQVTDDFMISPGNAATTVFSGASLPGTPKHMVTFLTEYSYPLAAGSELNFRLNGFYRNKTVNAFSPVDFNYGEIDGFGMVNAAITYQRENLSVSLFADNLTNAAGVTTGLFTPYFPPNLATRQIARPFTAGIRLNLKGK